MPSEGLTQLNYKSLESLKETFKQKLDAILHKQLTVENIETFADEALEETITLTDDVLAEYRNNPNIYPNVIPLNKQEQENEAFAILGLPDIQEILQLIIKVKDEIDSLKTYLENTEIINTVITPPQPNHTMNTQEGDGSFKKKETFPRLLTLLYIIQHDFGIEPTPENVPRKEGVVTSKMTRKTPYVRVEIPELKRVVYICEEEGNVSYIFDTKKLVEVGLALEEIDVDDKGDKNSLIAYHPGIGIRLKQTNRWRSRVAEFLREPIPETQTGILEEHDMEERVKISEFREKGEFLSFLDFQDKVKKLYPEGKGSIYKWYTKERIHHSNWPSHPDSTYKDKGWEDWRTLVERYLPFDKFQIEVRKLYPGKGSVYPWYFKEKRNHLKWPSHPNDTYKIRGWVGWSELVGVENHLKKEFLSFADFQTEVGDLYSRQENIPIYSWYVKERKKHPKWHSSPHRFYKDKGWIGWSELVGKENRFKKNK